MQAVDVPGAGAFMTVVVLHRGALCLNSAICHLADAVRNGWARRCPGADEPFPRRAVPQPPAILVASISGPAVVLSTILLARWHLHLPACKAQALIILVVYLMIRTGRNRAAPPPGGRMARCWR
jgi:L-asparagine transporter-like permease